MKHKRSLCDGKAFRILNMPSYRLKQIRLPYFVLVLVMVMVLVLSIHIFKSTLVTLPGSRKYIDTTSGSQSEFVSPLTINTDTIPGLVPTVIQTTIKVGKEEESLTNINDEKPNLSRANDIETVNRERSMSSNIPEEVRMRVSMETDGVQNTLAAGARSRVVYVSANGTGNNKNIGINSGSNITLGRGTKPRKPVKRPTTVPNPFCKATGLVGRISVNPAGNISHDMFKGHMDIRQGGWWRPPCLPRHKVAIIIPYRERKHHLLTLLYYLIPILKRQLLEFRIFVVEQEGNHTFNKGIIMNAGFKEAVRLSDYHCYIFHDVDLIPENDRNLYTCPGLPRHLSVAVDKFGYRLPYTALVGGVFAIRREDFETVNGYSNLYWGWGAEDDDMSIRLNVAGLPIARPSPTVARYKMLKHKGRVHAPGKWTDYLLKTVKKRFYKDGLSTVNYNVTFIHLERLFTHIMVDAGQPPSIVGNISAIIR